MSVVVVEENRSAACSVIQVMSKLQRREYECGVGQVLLLEHLD